MPLWENAYGSAPIKVQEDLRVSDSSMTMLMFDIAFRLTCYVGIPALTLIALNLSPSSPRRHYFSF
jgi:hypothetical protein